MTEPVALTFEQGYTRLQTVSKRVTSEEVPVAEMCELFAEGKGLQKSLTEYLGEQKGRVEAIDRGEGIQAFRIVPPSPSDTPAPTATDDVPVNAADFSSPEPAPRSVTPAPAPADDDIPF